MATIRPNENAPAEDVHYVLPTASFDLGEGGTYESDERAVLSAAADHPWLTVEYPEAASEVYTRPSKSVPYTEDPYSEYNDHSNDPELVAETERAKYDATVAPLAIDSGLDQSEPVQVDERVDVTLAAADAHEETYDDASGGAQEE